MNEKEIIAGKPRADNEKQIAITEKIKNKVLKEKWAQEMFAEVKNLQINYMKEMLDNVSDKNFVHDKTQEMLQKISGEFFKSQIIEGVEYLENLPMGTPVLITTNHFGAYKLLGVDTEKDLDVEMDGYNLIYPYPAYFAALYPVAAELADNLYYTSKEFPGIFGEIHKNIGSISVPIKKPKEGRMPNLIAQTNTLINERENVALVNFPEGTTSGKPSGRGPYDLEPFHTGGYVVSANIGMIVLPVAQYFNTKEGFKLRVFKPHILPKNTDSQTFQAYARDDQKNIQKWLNEQKYKDA